MGRKRSSSIYSESKNAYLQRLKEEEEYDTQDDQSNFLLKGKIIEESDEECSNLVRKLTEEIKPQSDNENPNEFKSEETEERELVEQMNCLNKVYKYRESQGKQENSKQNEGLNILCSYFTGRMKSKDEIKLVIHPSIKSRKPLRSMSQNSIYEINIKKALDVIMKTQEDEEEERMNNLYINKKKSSRFSTYSSSSNSISKEIFIQNVESEEVMKIMLVGSTLIGKTKLINNFLECRKNKYIPSNGLEIKKKNEKLLNKSVRIEFFDTDANFHLRDTSQIYYKICDAFIYVVDCSKSESFNYIRNIHRKIFDNSYSKSFVLVTTHQSNENLQDQDVYKLIEGLCEEYSIKLLNLSNVDDFTFHNNSVHHIFSSMFIKKMNSRSKNNYIWNKRKQLKKGTNPSSCSTNGSKKIMDHPDNFGHSDFYQLEAYNNFEEEEIKLESRDNLTQIRKSLSCFELAQLN